MRQTHPKGKLLSAESQYPPRLEPKEGGVGACCFESPLAPAQSVRPISTQGFASHEGTNRSGGGVFLCNL